MPTTNTTQYGYWYLAEVDEKCPATYNVQNSYQSYGMNLTVDTMAYKVFMKASNVIPAGM